MKVPVLLKTSITPAAWNDFIQGAPITLPSGITAQRRSGQSVGLTYPDLSTMLVYNPGIRKKLRTAIRRELGDILTYATVDPQRLISIAKKSDTYSDASRSGCVLWTMGK